MIHLHVIVCTGGRDFTDMSVVERAFDPWLMCILGVVVGCARGADALVREYCRLYGLPIRVCYADWSQHGKAAGIIRNKEMIAEAVRIAEDTGSRLRMFAFPGGRGTAHARQVFSQLTLTEPECYQDD